MFNTPQLPDLYNGMVIPPAPSHQALVVQPSTAIQTTDDTERIKRFIDASRADNTKKAYATHWQQFAEWCDRTGHTALPAAPFAVAAYVTHLAELKAKPSTIQAKLSAISNAHRAADADNPTSNEIVRKAMSGIRRTLTTKRTQKAPAALDELTAMLAAIPGTPAGIRDRAILTLGFAGAFRRSELAALNVDDLRVTKNALFVTVRSSKTDQEGEGNLKRIPMLNNAAICPMRAMLAWLKVANISAASVFRPVDRHGHISSARLTPHAIAIIVKTAADRAGLDPAQYSGHSLRAGFVTQSYNAGTPEADIMEVTGHKSLAVMHQYKRNADTAQPKAIRAAFGE